MNADALIFDVNENYVNNWTSTGNLLVFLGTQTLYHQNTKWGNILVFIVNNKNISWVCKLTEIDNYR